ncbi:protein AE7-like isoform X1 [Quercus robur]|uniref:protein AE7-like isoform X1 n=1 Tax=Quercus robur TaxID=38942 RepID=UPI0021614CB4|nr:protein AE7-like isoform X1 [Quercus robur]XP_050251344.1 protein AE7-like isoform X1 [Quercus robur]XP_050251345.1 protein AE7-like isoform X1 [Quercus robur]XP_050251346.1 protein AE7-like isoform X1 [Quercus robur]
MPTVVEEYAVEPIDQQEVFDHVRDIKDLEHPYSLEELKVITEDAIEIDDQQSYVRITFTPTVEHCSMATIIGLCLRVKLLRSLPSRYKVDIRLPLDLMHPSLQEMILQVCHIVSEIPSIQSVVLLVNTDII